MCRSIIMMAATVAVISCVGACVSSPEAKKPAVEPEPSVFVPARSAGIPVRKWGIDTKHPYPVVKDPKLTNLIIIGDSTVRNLGQKGAGGWGDHIAPFFDESRINIVNWALGGRSSRSFIEEGRWDAALAQMKAGDYVLLQLGHNDAKVHSDRGTIKGVGEETQDVAQKDSNEIVTVHTYGWYLRQYVKDVRAKKATLVFCTPVPRNSWDSSGKMRGSMGDYSALMKQVAEEEDVLLIDLNAIVIKHYDELGQEKVANEFFGVGDSTHTSLEGAKANASYVVEGIKAIKDLGLNKYLNK